VNIFKMTALHMRAVKAAKNWLNKSDRTVQVTWPSIIFVLHS
jgi:hypothetical protein